MKLVVLAHASNHSTKEAEAGILPLFRGLPELPGESLGSLGYKVRLCPPNKPKAKPTSKTKINSVSVPTNIY